MKKYLFSISFFLLGISLFAQAPQGINFQAVARKSDGNPMSNSTVKVTFKIRHGSPSANALFEETHTNIPTDDCGMFRLTIGSIDPNNSFENIEWSTGFKWLEVLVDDFSIGNQEMLSVPYALYAETSGNGGTTYSAGQGISIVGGVISNTGDSDNSPTNEIQTLTLSGNQLILSNGGGTVMLPPGSGTDAQTLSLTGNQLSISNGNAVNLPPDSDAQSLTISGNQLSISNGNAVTLPPDADSNPTNEIQTLALSGSQLSLSNGGGTVVLPTGGTDAQTLSLNGNQLSISNGNMVSLPQDGDGSSTNEIQTLSLSGSQLMLSNGGGAVNLPPDADAQTLSLSGDQLIISGGNSVTIPNNAYQAGSGISIVGGTITNTALSPVIQVNSANMSTVTAPDGSIVAITGEINLTGEYSNIDDSPVVMGGIVNGNGNEIDFANYAVITGVVFNNVAIDAVATNFQGCTFNGVTDLPSNANFTGCKFSNCVFPSINYSGGSMNNCLIENSSIPDMDRITNCEINNSTLGSTSRYIGEISNSDFDDSYIYVAGIFNGNICDNTQVLTDEGADNIAISNNTFVVSSSGLSTDFLSINMSDSGRRALNISNNNFLGATSNPSGQYIRFYGSYTGTRCIARVSNNIFIGGSAKAISYECTGQVDLMVNDNDLRSVSGGLGVSNGGFVTIRNNVTH